MPTSAHALCLPLDVDVRGLVVADEHRREARDVATALGEALDTRLYLRPTRAAIALPSMTIASGT